MESNLHKGLAGRTMARLTLFSPNVCNGLIVLAVGAMSCAIVYAGVVLLMLLR